MKATPLNVDINMAHHLSSLWKSAESLIFELVSQFTERRTSRRRFRKIRLCLTHLQMKQSLPIRDCSSFFLQTFFFSHFTNRFFISVIRSLVTEIVMFSVSINTPRTVCTTEGGHDFGTFSSSPRSCRSCPRWSYASLPVEGGLTPIRSSNSIQFILVKRSVPNGHNY